MVKFGHILPPLQLITLRKLLPQEVFPQLLLNDLNSAQCLLLLVRLALDSSTVPLQENSHAVRLLTEDLFSAVCVHSEPKSRPKIPNSNIGLIFQNLEIIGY